MVAFVGVFVYLDKPKKHEATSDWSKRVEAEFAAVASKWLERPERIRAKYPDPEMTQKILDEILWVGETAEQVRDSLGEPDAVDERVLKTRRREVWKYDEITRGRYRRRITLDGGVVVSWTTRDA
jgi:hypothetical protein